MSRYYDKDQLKDSLTIEQIYDLLDYWGGEPELTSKGLIAQTICHNLPGEGSRKLYYYSNSRLFHCFSGCTEPSFDIFELCIKIAKKQKNREYELYDAMDFIASYFGISGIDIEKKNSQLKDWDIFKRHEYQDAKNRSSIELKEYDPIILERFSYPRIIPWEQEGISPEVMKKNKIGYYPCEEQITIPHFDIKGRLIGIRGRYLSEDNANRFGKYRPLLVNKQLYNHPLSLNLYNLNNSKDNIKKSRLAIVFESEKSALKYSSYYGEENDISVSICGSSLSDYQVSLLCSIGAREIIIAFDRDFESIGDEIFNRLKTRLIHIYNKYNNLIKITAIFDKNMILPLKASPIDVEPAIFEKLLKERIVPSGIYSKSTN